MEAIKGYKVFKSDWTCRDKQYTCPGTFEEYGTPEPCKRGMHFCRNAMDCFKYYEFDPSLKVAEVEAYGDVVETETKSCTNKLKIIREVSWSELLDLVNLGYGNSGLGNVGRLNTGKYNVGSYNKGSCNSGNFNTGDTNSGDFNSGNGNAGCFNSGVSNIGEFNSGQHNIGVFNTLNNEKLYIFNKPSNWTMSDWIRSEARDAMWRMMKFSQTHSAIDMQIVWHLAISESERDAILSLPNFDPDIFKEITGVDVRAAFYKKFLDAIEQRGNENE